jgi:hypothetical protein
MNFRLLVRTHCVYYQSIEHSLMASVYLSFLSDKQPEIHCSQGYHWKQVYVCLVHLHCRYTHWMCRVFIFVVSGLQCNTQVWDHLPNTEVFRLVVQYSRREFTHACTLVVIWIESITHAQILVAIFGQPTCMNTGGGHWAALTGFVSELCTCVCD